MTPSFTIFIPMYNVSERVLGVLDAIPAKALEHTKEVILIDNGSQDNTAEKVRAYLAARGDRRFRLLRNRENYYLGGSTVVAFRESIANGSDFMVCLHSDGQADPAYLDTFVERAKPELDFIFGSRLQEGASVGEYSWPRLLGNKFFSWIQRRITGQNFHDIGAFVAFNLQTIRRLPYWRIPHDMAYQPLLVLYACSKLPVRFLEFPIHWGKVEHSNVNIFSYGLTHLFRLLAMRAGRFPLTGSTLSKFESEELPWR